MFRILRRLFQGVKVVSYDPAPCVEDLRVEDLPRVEDVNPFLVALIRAQQPKR